MIKSALWSRLPLVGTHPASIGMTSSNRDKVSFIWSEMVPSSTGMTSSSRDGVGLESIIRDRLVVEIIVALVEILKAEKLSNLESAETWSQDRKKFIDQGNIQQFGNTGSPITKIVNERYEPLPPFRPQQPMQPIQESSLEDLVKQMTMNNIQFQQNVFATMQDLQTQISQLATTVVAVQPPLSSMVQPLHALVITANKLQVEQKEKLSQDLKKLGDFYEHLVKHSTLRLYLELQTFKWDNLGSLGKLRRRSKTEFLSDSEEVFPLFSIVFYYDVLSIVFYYDVLSIVFYYDVLSIADQQMARQCYVNNLKVGTIDQPKKRMDNIVGSIKLNPHPPVEQRPEPIEKLQWIRLTDDEH
ncbi:hypothetical protein CR513_16648, partial [Mucuna pruriens]